MSCKRITQTVSLLLETYKVTDSISSWLLPIRRVSPSGESFSDLSPTTIAGHSLSNRGDTVSVIEKSIDIQASIQACYAAWLDVPSYPLFIKNLHAVRPHPQTHHNTWIWLTWTPLGKDEEWEVELDNEDTHWYALNPEWGAYRCNFVMKSTGPHTTHLNVILEYVPSPQAIRECGRRLSHFPKHILDVHLDRFKTMVEHPHLIKTKLHRSIHPHPSKSTLEHPPCGI